MRSAGGVDVVLGTSNSWKVMADALKALRPDGRLILMGLSDEPLQVPLELLIQQPSARNLKAIRHISHILKTTRPIDGMQGDPG